MVPENLFGFKLVFFSAFNLQRHKSCQLASDQWHIWSSTGEEQPEFAAIGKWARKREISSLQTRDDSCPQDSCKVRFHKHTSYVLTLSPDASGQEQKYVVFAVAAASSCICSIIRVVNWDPAVLGNVQVWSRRAVSSPRSSQLMGKAREHRWAGPKRGERK